MEYSGKETVLSGVIVSVLGYVLWPWRAGEFWQWYTHLPDEFRGDGAVLAGAMIVTVAIGIAIIAATRITVTHLAIGGTIAYVFWMAVLTVFFPLHDFLPYFVYGQVIVGALLGGALATLAGRGLSIWHRPHSS